MDATHHLAQAGGFEDLEMLSDWVHGLSEAPGLSPRASFQLELVLTEALTNTMEHACACTNADAEHCGAPIELDCDCRDGLIHLELCDTGPPFDPSLHVHVQAADLTSCRPAGVGIHLMWQYIQDM